jgi:sulfide:quinone oxidoreductase
MPFNELDAKLSASPQLTPNDVAAAAMQGYRTIIDLRPDGEEPGQPSAATIEAVAREHGLAFVHIPVVPGEVSEAQVRIMNRALDEKPTPRSAIAAPEVASRRCGRLRWRARPTRTR